MPGACQHLHTTPFTFRRLDLPYAACLFDGIGECHIEGLALWSAALVATLSSRLCKKLLNGFLSYTKCREKPGLHGL